MANGTDDRKNTTVTESDQKIRVRMDDSNLESTYTNVANVWGTREEIMVDFGMSGVRRTGDREITLTMNKRMVMSPFTAKRLSLMLSQAMDRYEAQHGKLDVAQRRANVPDISHSSEDMDDSSTQ